MPEETSNKTKIPVIYQKLIKVFGYILAVFINKASFFRRSTIQLRFTEVTVIFRFMPVPRLNCISLPQRTIIAAGNRPYLGFGDRINLFDGPIFHVDKVFVINTHNHLGPERARIGA